MLRPPDTGAEARTGHRGQRRAPAAAAADTKSKVTEEMRAQVPPELLAQLASSAFIDSCMQSFDALDVNKDGKLSLDELTRAAKQHSASGGKAWPKKHIEKTLAQYDTNGDGFLDKAEWTAVLLALVVGVPPPEPSRIVQRTLW